MDYVEGERERDESGAQGPSRRRVRPRCLLCGVSDASHHVAPRVESCVDSVRALAARRRPARRAGPIPDRRAEKLMAYRFYGDFCSSAPEATGTGARGRTDGNSSAARGTPRTRPGRRRGSGPRRCPRPGPGRRPGRRAARGDAENRGRAAEGSAEAGA